MPTPGNGPPHVELRNATDDDLAWLVDLRRQVMGPHIEASGKPLSRDKERASVLRDFGCIQIVCVQASAVGMIKVVRGASAWRLVQVQLLPALQGQGIGTQLIEMLQRDATERSVPIELSVLAVNPAKALYARLGFEVLRKKPRSWEMRWRPRHPLAARFVRFQDECREMDAPWYAELAALVAQRSDLLDIASHATREPVPNLFFGAIHDLLLGGTGHPLADYYASLNILPRRDEQLPSHFADFCLQHREVLIETLRARTVQTNEVRRAACLLPCFAHVHAAGMDKPLALVEMGTSAGLLLAFDHYRYRYDDRELGRDDSALILSCELRGVAPPLPDVLPAVAVRRGIDLHPIDPANPTERRWLRALVWPEHPERAARLESALDVAREVTIERIAGDAIQVLPAALRDLPAEATACFFHSSTINQFTSDQREALQAVLAACSADRPIHELAANGASIHWIVHEQGMRSERLLATYDSHGRWMTWHAPMSTRKGSGAS